MVKPRSGDTAILLNDGTVLLAGGDDDGVALSDAELFDSVAAKFSPTGGMQSQRSGHAMNYLGAGGVVLITGGFGAG